MVQIIFSFLLKHHPRSISAAIFHRHHTPYLFTSIAILTDPANLSTTASFLFATTPYIRLQFFDHTPDNTHGFS